MRQLIIAIVIALVAVIFAIQNATPATVKFLLWTIPETSMALMLLITLVIGMIAGMLFLAPGIYRRNQTIEQQRQRIDRLEIQISASPGNKPVL